jgi:hypothetical protein
VSWATVRAALKTRFEAISTAALALPTPLPAFRVHEFMRWVSDGPNGDDFQAKFAINGRLCVLRMTRSGWLEIQGDDTRTRVQHQVLLEFSLAIDEDAASELLHQDLLDLMRTNFREGDRTLGGVAITHSNLAGENITDGMLVGVSCHTADLRLVVEEVVS